MVFATLPPLGNDGKKNYCWYVMEKWVQLLWLDFFYFKLQAGADAAVDVGVICTEGSMWSELSMIVPTHTSVKVE